MATHTAMTQGNDPDVRGLIERNVGILYFVSPKEHAWNGVTRKRYSNRLIFFPCRYTDFQVHEITKDGKVVKLEEFSMNSREYTRKEAAKAGKTQAPDAPANATPQQSANPVAANGASNAAAGQPADAVGTTAPESKDAPKEADAKPHSEFLVNLVGQSVFDDLTNLYNKICEDPKMKPAKHGSMKLPVIEDRQMRTKVHAEIREAFSGKIETSTDQNGNIVATAAGSNKRWNNRGNGRDPQAPNPRKLGKFLHFTLYKENRDTMEAVGNIARILKEHPKMFSTAGTKDRRAVTSQRVSVKSRDPSKMLFINDRIRDIKIGDFKFEEKDLYLGCLKGNEFTIVMKDCVFRDCENEPFEKLLETAQSTIDNALERIHERGFINYFGTQRFGTFEIGTNKIGLKILKDDFEGAIMDLLSFDASLTTVDTSIPRPGEFVRFDDIARAKALAKFQETGNADEACKELPRRANLEFGIIKHLAKQPKDFVGALMSIPRNMRSMYLHSYQSLVWNFVASKRWELFGDSIVKGDLVLANASQPAKAKAEDDDEENIHLSKDNDDDFEIREEAHVVTEEDIQTGRYTIRDVVLPCPGCDIVYPDNEVGKYYVEFMGKDENGALDPYNMQRRQKEFSLTGAYRKFIGTFIDRPTGSVRSYVHDNDQLVPTDWDEIQAQREAQRAKEQRERQERGANNQDGKMSGWFNIQADDRRIAEAAKETERRKAEEGGDTEVRFNDTWVQTSLDGSNKRIKVDKQVNIVEGGEPSADAEAASVPDTQAAATGAKEQAPAPVDDAMDISSDTPAKIPAESPAPEARKIAVVLKFALPSSEYATIVLRELQG
ncbi:trna pseudouridine synthase d protein [Apiospora rasikravindrae]|uniref:Trna pseudouridine synthase d protein n=1 Tax=Apiospora rasikravindrae TaxID=990691 RepID=A0ABR1RXI8_9PEZI